MLRMDSNSRIRHIIRVIQVENYHGYLTEKLERRFWIY